LVIGDAVAELELYSQVFAVGSVEKSGQKRRRLSTEQTSLGIDSMRCIQPLLLCLENSLRSDALGGGNWIRSDENQRYHAILEPLGRLLACKLPSDFPVPEGTESAYKHLVRGSDDETGTVIGCLTALAGAAGNEQMWKPLNHAVLEACGNDTRGDVRKSGLICLTNLMRSLGEEYMVLLPECLPVLSELLEDREEEIVGLARECVQLAEDLIGESLEESLR
jgi:hypothetical protein